MAADRYRACPKCQPPRRLNELSAIGPYGEVCIDVCSTCRGAWCDWGEVGELRELAILLQQGLNIPGTGGASRYERDLQPGSCPACVESPQLSALLVGAFHIDRCDECLGLWFDGGELGPMLTEQGFEALLGTLRKHPV